MEAASERIKALRASITETARASGRDPKSILLILVTKQIGAEKILEAYRAGERDFGENRVQDLVRKAAELPSDIRWHMIGHLQTNKVKAVVGLAHAIHSLDSLRLAEALDGEAGMKSIGNIPVLIEVNTSGESSKFGMRPEEVPSFVASCLPFKHLNLRGLMTIAPHGGGEEKIRSAFRLLCETLAAIKRRYPAFNGSELSMGMSGDYRLAIEEGATMIRVGTAVFGERVGKNEDGL